MLDGMKSQVNEVMDGILGIGKKKHFLKIEIQKRYDAHCKNHILQPSKRGLWHYYGLHLPVCSYGTAITYKKIWRRLLKFARRQGIKYIYDITADIVHEFLLSKIGDNVSRRTFKLYVSALTKLQAALSIYSNKMGLRRVYEFDLGPDNELRIIARKTLKQEIEDRAYESPLDLMYLLCPRHLLFFILQYVYGMRVIEAVTLKRKNLIGGYRIKLTNAKGGLRRILFVHPEIYRLLLTDMNLFGGKLTASGEKITNVVKNYRNNIKRAATKTGQEYHGTHGLRWSFAQETFEILFAAGKSRKEILGIISRRLGHVRPEITLHYLTPEQKNRKPSMPGRVPPSFPFEKAISIIEHWIGKNEGLISTTA